MTVMTITNSGFILNTSRGFVPHLCMDILEKTILKCKDKIVAIKIYADTLLENKRMVFNCPMTMRQFYGIPSFIPIIMSMNNRKYYLGEGSPLNSSSNSIIMNNGSDWITIENASGLSKMNIQDYKRIVDIWKPDMFIIPSDHYKIYSFSDIIANEKPRKEIKRQRKAIERNKNYQKYFIEYSNAIQSINIIQEESTIKLSDCNIYEIIRKSNDIQSIKDIVSKLPKNSKKYLVGSIHPMIIRELKALIDYFDTSFVDQITNDSNALIIEKEKDQIELLDLKDGKYATIMNCIDSSCECWVCHGKEAVTLSYLYHLVDAKEMLASVMLQSHNLYQYINRSLLFV